MIKHTTPHRRRPILKKKAMRPEHKRRRHSGPWTSISGHADMGELWTGLAGAGSDAIKHLMSLSHSAHLPSRKRLSSACYPFLAAGLDLLEDVCEKLIGEGEDEFGVQPAMVEFLRPFFQFLYYSYFRVEAEGVSHVPNRGPAILVANHAGALPYDGTMVHLAVYNEHPAKREVRFLVDDFVFHLPLVSTIIQRTGGIKANMENATRLIQHNHLVMIFPEGVKGMGKTYDHRYQLQRFGRGGFVRLALRTKTPVVPVAIIGSEEIHPLIWKSHQLAKPLGLPFMPFTPTFPWLGPLGLVPLPSKWQIIFGPPMRYEHLKPTDAENPGLVFDEADKVRVQIQDMIYKALSKRKSTWV